MVSRERLCTQSPPADIVTLASDDNDPDITKIIGGWVLPSDKAGLSTFLAVSQWSL